MNIDLGDDWERRVGVSRIWYIRPSHEVKWMACTEGGSMSRKRGGRHGVALNASARNGGRGPKDDVVVFRPRDPANVIRWGTPFAERIPICEDEHARWKFEWLVALRELEEMDATPEMYSARLTIVDVAHDADRLARMFRQFAKGSRTIRRPDDARRYDDVAEEIEHRYDGIRLVSVDGDGVAVA